MPVLSSGMNILPSFGMMGRGTCDGGKETESQFLHRATLGNAQNSLKAREPQRVELCLFLNRLNVFYNYARDDDPGAFIQWESIIHFYSQVSLTLSLSWLVLPHPR